MIDNFCFWAYKTIWLWRCNSARRKTKRERDNITEMAAGRIMEPPYPVMFSLVDRILADLDEEIQIMLTAQSFEELEHLDLERAAHIFKEASDRLEKDIEEFKSSLNFPKLSNEEVLAELIALEKLAKDVRS